jgi:cell division protein DivIC
MSLTRTDNILAFQGRNAAIEQRRKERPVPLHPKVRRRRLIWLSIMVLVCTWSLIELIIQQNRIWEKEELLAVRKTELNAEQAKMGKLREEINKLNDEKYLLELARQKGFGKPEGQAESVLNPEE